MAKLSKVQVEVLEKMANGWKLGRSASIINSRAWLQNGGCGRGGESLKVSSATLKALMNAGLIVRDTFKYPTQTYSLSVAEEPIAVKGKAE